MGHAFEGAGGLAGFISEAGLIGKGIKGASLLGKAAEGTEEAINLAEKTEKYAVNTKMFIDGYNSAYNNSFDVIGKGDSATDEAKRQAYSMLNGLVTTAIFSISPKTQIIKNALGESKPLINEVVSRITAEGIDAFKNPKIKDKLIKGIASAIKEDGKQVGLATAAQVFTNLENIVSSKENKFKVGDNVSQTAMSTAIAMSIPSIMSGIGQGARLSPINRDVVVEIGSAPDQYINSLRTLKDEGKISEQDFRKSFATIYKMRDAVESAPREHPATGQPFTEEQQKNYAVLELKRKLLGEKKTELENRKASDIEVKSVDKAIKEVEGFQQEIMDKVANPPEPEEVVIPEPGAEPVAEEVVAEEPIVEPTAHSEEVVAPTEIAEEIPTEESVVEPGRKAN